MSFYNILLDLCIEKNIKPTTAVKEMGITGPAVNRWKNGSMPNDVTLMKIAKYFDVSIEYLKTGQEPEAKKDQSSCVSFAVLLSQPDDPAAGIHRQQQGVRHLSVVLREHLLQPVAVLPCPA